MTTRRIDPSRHTIYLKKAAEFERAMESAAIREDWNAVGLGAVHVAISAGDALTTALSGERASGESHLEIVGLLRTLPLSDARERAKQAADVIQEKNLIAYQDAVFDEKSAKRVQKQAARFHAWVREQLRQ